MLTQSLNKQQVLILLIIYQKNQESLNNHMMKETFIYFTYYLKVKIKKSCNHIFYLKWSNLTILTKTNVILFKIQTILLYFKKFKILINHQAWLTKLNIYNKSQQQFFCQVNFSLVIKLLLTPNLVNYNLKKQQIQLLD